MVMNKLQRSVYNQQKAQAKYRKEEWDIDFDRWSALWNEDDQWLNRGTYVGAFRMRRIDANIGWCPSNIIITDKVTPLLNQQPITCRKPINVGAGHAAKCRPCVVNGVEFPSVRAAGTYHGMAPVSVKYRLRTAKYDQWNYLGEEL